MRHDYFVRDWAFAFTSPLGFYYSLGVCDGDAAHLADFVEFSDIYVSGFTEFNGCCGYIAEGGYRPVQC